MKKETFKFRYVISKGATYLHKEDVQEFIKLLASSEATDVRIRLNEAAYNIKAAVDNLLPA